MRNTEVAEKMTSVGTLLLFLVVPRAQLLIA
jgi:hypothetical protein